MDLYFALSIQHRDVVAFVGGGGKSTTMFRLARELVAQGRRIVTTTTTHFAAAQAQLPPACLVAPDAESALREVPALIEQHRHVMVVSGSAGDEGKAVGIDPDLVCKLSRLAEVDIVLVEADGSRLRPFKAPGAQEPVISDCATIVVPVVGVDVLGQPLDADHVHRPEIVARLAEASLGMPITQEIVAAVLAHRQGALKGCPPRARVVLLINKVENPGQLAAARRLALLLSRMPPGGDESEIGPEHHAASFAFDAVLLGAVACDTPIREVHTRTVGIVLAAGGSSRLGRPKQLLDWHGEPLVSRMVRTALAAGLSEVVVVVGHRAQQVQTILAGLPVTVADNPEWIQGLSTSIRAGLRAAAPGWGAAIFIPADQPRLTPQVIDRLVKRHRESLAPIVYPGFEGRRGTPTLFDRGLAAELETLHGDRGGSALFAKYQDRIQMIPVTDAAVLDDIDTEDDYERLLGYDQP